MRRHSLPVVGAAGGPTLCFGRRDVIFHDEHPYVHILYQLR
jgi:hypothetical protein